MLRVWFHDILYPNGTAFTQYEEKFYFLLSKKKSDTKPSFKTMLSKSVEEKNARKIFY